jgi:hypothetical protein
MKWYTWQENKQINISRWLYRSAGTTSVNVGFEVFTVVALIFSDVTVHGPVENLPMFCRSVASIFLRSNGMLRKRPARMFLRKVGEPLSGDITRDQ